MIRILQKPPLYSAFLVKLVIFPDILPHKQKLLAGMGHMIRVGQTQIRKLLLPLSRHPAKKRALAVYHLVVGQHQHKLLAVGVDHAESQIVVPPRAEEGIRRDIAQIVIHKAHIPFQVKAQTVLVQRTRDLRPRCGLLRNHQHPRIAFLHNGV